MYLRGTPTWSPENNCTGFQTNDAIKQPGCLHIYISRLLHPTENEIVLLESSQPLLGPSRSTKRCVTTLITAAKNQKETLISPEYPNKLGHLWRHEAIVLK